MRGLLPPEVQERLETATPQERAALEALRSSRPGGTIAVLERSLESAKSTLQNALPSDPETIFPVAELEARVASLHDQPVAAGGVSLEALRGLDRARAAQKAWAARPLGERVDLVRAGIAVLGAMTLFKLLIGRVSLTELEERASKVLKVRVKGMPFPHAELGMDIDRILRLFEKYIPGFGPKASERIKRNRLVRWLSDD